MAAAKSERKARRSQSAPTPLNPSQTTGLGERGKQQNQRREAPRAFLLGTTPTQDGCGQERAESATQPIRPYSIKSLPNRRFGRARKTTKPKARSAESFFAGNHPHAGWLRPKASGKRDAANPPLLH